jgi:protein XagA
MRACLLVLSVLFVQAAGDAAWAGAFMLTPGTGQFIAGVGYTEATRRFDSYGDALPTPTFNKVEAIGYFEYGVSTSVDLVLAPTLSHQDDGPATNTVTGSDSSAVGARLALYQAPGSVLSVQALVQPPIGSENLAAQIADGGARTFATDVRVMAGREVALFGWDAFLDVEPGVRLRASPFPDEARIDATLGVHLSPRLMALAQEFSSFAGPSGTLIPRTDWSKAQLSLVYELSPRWSFQLGGLSTFAGRNIVRERGPFAAIWCRL